MQKQTTVIKGLISLTLLTFINSIHAQESVSSYEQSVINQTASAKSAQTGNDLVGIPANYDMEALTKALDKRGWDIQRKADGSLILIPKTSPDKPSDKKTSTNDQWLQLQQEFQNAGWSAELDADGAINLTPPAPAPASKPEATSQIQSSENLSFKDMQEKLKASGWGVSTNSDGSVLLYPPKKAATKKLRSCPGIKPVVKVSLPVDNWQEAHDIAQGWLSNESIPNSTVGKIRKIFNVYIISIVSDSAPFSLMHQIAVNNSNGTVIILN